MEGLAGGAGFLQPQGEGEGGMSLSSAVRRGVEKVQTPLEVRRESAGGHRCTSRPCKVF